MTTGPDRHDYLIQAKTCHSVNNVAFDKALMIQSTLINRKVRRGFSTIWVPKYGDFVRGNQLQSLNIWQLLWRVGHDGWWWVTSQSWVMSLCFFCCTTWDVGSFGELEKQWMVVWDLCLSPMINDQPKNPMVTFCRRYGRKKTGVMNYSRPHFCFSDHDFNWLVEGRCPSCWQAKIEILNKNTTSDLHLVSVGMPGPSGERWTYNTVTEHEMHLELSGIDWNMQPLRSLMKTKSLARVWYMTWSRIRTAN